MNYLVAKQRVSGAHRLRFLAMQASGPTQELQNLVDREKEGCGDSLFSRIELVQGRMLVGDTVFQLATNQHAVYPLNGDMGGVRASLLSVDLGLCMHFASSFCPWCSCSVT